MERRGDATQAVLRKGHGPSLATRDSLLSLAACLLLLLLLLRFDVRVCWQSFGEIHVLAKASVMRHASVESIEQERVCAKNLRA